LTGHAGYRLESIKNAATKLEILKESARKLFKGRLPNQHNISGRDYTLSVVWRTQKLSSLSREMG